MSPFRSSNARWAAVMTREPAASSAFIYCVKSTNIYCRPTCPGRLARRANVTFLDDAQQAEAAGYRACLRCRPKDADEAAGDPQKRAVARACDLIQEEVEQTCATRWTVRELALEVGWTESHFCRVFRKITGLTIGEYRKKNCRKHHSKDLKSGTPSTFTKGLQTAASIGFDTMAGLLVRDSFHHEILQDRLDLGDLLKITSSHQVPSDMLKFDAAIPTFSFPTPESLPTPVMDDGLHFLNFDT